MGDQKTTVELEKPPAWAIEMSQRMSDGVASLNARLDTIETNVSVLVDDKKATNERLSRLENWKETEVNARLNANSERVKGESEVNMKQDAAIAQILTQVQALSDKPDTAALVLAKMEAAAKTPTGQKILGGVVTALLLGLTLLGANLKAKVDNLDSRPVTVQPAPTVYIQIPADGGVK